MSERGLIKCIDVACRVLILYPFITVIHSERWMAGDDLPRPRLLITRTMRCVLLRNGPSAFRHAIILTSMSARRPAWTSRPSGQLFFHLSFEKNRSRSVAAQSLWQTRWVTWLFATPCTLYRPCDKMISSVLFELFYWQKNPGLSRTLMKNFPGPFRSLRMFKYKEKKRHLLTISRV